MKLIAKIKSCCADIGKLSVAAYKGYESAIHDLSRRCEAENRLASISSYRFVNAFNQTANAISAARRDPNIETYLSLCAQAGEMLCAGVEEADVLWYFDLLLKKEMKGGAE